MAVVNLSTVNLINGSSDTSQLASSSSIIYNDEAATLLQNNLKHKPDDEMRKHVSSSDDDEENETYNDADDVFKTSNSGNEDTSSSSSSVNEPTETNDRNRLLVIKSISSHQLNDPINIITTAPPLPPQPLPVASLPPPLPLSNNNAVNIKRISVSKCFLSLNDSELEGVGIADIYSNNHHHNHAVSNRQSNYNEASKTNTSKTVLTTTTNSSSNTNVNSGTTSNKKMQSSNSVYMNDLKHKHRRLVGSYCTLTRSRSSSLTSSVSSSASSSRSGSPSNASGTSLFAGSPNYHNNNNNNTSFSNNNQSKISPPVSVNKKNKTKKIKLSVVAAAANTNPVRMNIQQQQQQQQQQQRKNSIVNVVAANGGGGPPSANNLKCTVNGVAKKVARYNRFAKLRKTLNSGGKSHHEETRLTKKYAGSNFSIATACSATNSMKRLKCLLVGDPCVGKSTLMHLFLKHIFQTEYQPTIVDDFEVKVNLNGENYTLNLFDTAGQEDWETLRVMAYPDSDVIILCFSVVRPDSMENILSKWIGELNRYIPNVLIVLVGTQVDLRDASLANMDASDSNYRQRHISSKEGEEVRQRIKAFKYIECSALTQVNVKEVFDSCIDAYNSRIKPVQPVSCFRILFRSFANSLRRFRFHRRTAANAASDGGDAKAKLNKYGKSGSRKYRHES